ncbi:MAG TPA: hypothetical protein VJ242_04715 [Patescibacteria group bacterium]|nr:hypothetical protein [Patescibacteria group bacterium]
MKISQEALSVIGEMGERNSSGSGLVIGYLDAISSKDMRKFYDVVEFGEVDPDQALVAIGDNTLQLVGVLKKDEFVLLKVGAYNMDTLIPRLQYAENIAEIRDRNFKPETLILNDGRVYFNRAFFNDVDPSWQEQLDGLEQFLQGNTDHSSLPHYSPGELVAVYDRIGSHEMG